MDQIDLALNQAWGAMLDRIAADPGELARRRARAARVRARPVRAWCLAIRAGDARIDDWGLSWTVDDAAQAGRAHNVPLTQWDLEDLSVPVHIRWPGLPLGEFAAALGRCPANIAQWRRKGAVRAEKIDARALDRRIGAQIHLHWADSPLDPNAALGRPPHPMWGTLWQSLAKNVPRDWSCTLRRLRAGDRPNPEWFWQCPGRFHRATDLLGGQCEGATDPRSERSAPRPPPGPAGHAPVATGQPATAGAARGTQRPGSNAPAGQAQPPSPEPADSQRPPAPPLLHVPCDRLVKTLYLPLPCWTIADFRGEAEALGIPSPPWADLHGQLPACIHCWRVVGTTTVTSEGWNQLVSHVTGGLLSGREVRRPIEEAPSQRRRPARTRRGHPDVALRRRRVRVMLLAGASQKEIARALGATRVVVERDAAWIYRQAGIPQHRGPKRWELVRRLQWGGAAEVDVKGELGLTGKRAEVAQLLVRGLKYREIADELGTTHGSVVHHARRIYRDLGVERRAGLRARLGVGIEPAAEPRAAAERAAG
jgi:DNA-binding CsgD family transcriptional regulator